MKLELIIPESLNEVPLLHYQQFVDDVKGSEDNDYIGQRLVERFCGIELKEIVKIKQKDILNLTNHFNELFKKKNNFKPRFKIQNVEFGFITDLENITSGEYIDLEKYLQDVNTLHKAMAVMYRPIVKEKGDKYEIEPYKSALNYAEVMQYAPLSIVLAAQVFFWSLGQQLLKAIPSFLEAEMKKMSKKQQETLAEQLNLQNNGGGIQVYMNSLKGMLEDSMKLQNFPFINV
jgi:hypothetical protein